METGSILERTGIAPNLRTALIDGGTAGAHEVLGIRPGNLLAEVIFFDIGGDPANVLDIELITDEFLISDVDEISNAGSGNTNTSGGKLLVRWFAPTG